MPATGSPEQLVSVPDDGVPRTGVVNVGLVKVLFVRVVVTESKYDFRAALRFAQVSFLVILAASVSIMASSSASTGVGFDVLPVRKVFKSGMIF